MALPSGRKLSPRWAFWDHEEQDVAQEGAPVHVPRRRRMREHGEEVGCRVGVDSLVPQANEAISTFLQDGIAFRLCRNQAGIEVGGCDVGPVDESAPLLEREAEHGGKHLRGQFHGNELDPVKGLVAGKPIENSTGAVPVWLSRQKTLPIVPPPKPSYEYYGPLLLLTCLAFVVLVWRTRGGPWPP